MKKSAIFNNNYFVEKSGYLVKEHLSILFQKYYCEINITDSFKEKIKNKIEEIVFADYNDDQLTKTILDNLFLFLYVDENKNVIDISIIGMNIYINKNTHEYINDIVNEVECYTKSETLDTMTKSILEKNCMRIEIKSFKKMIENKKIF